MIEDPPAVRIRAVEARDVEPLAALVREVLAEFGLEFGVGSATDEDVLRLPASYLDHGGAFWIAEDELGLLGSCGIFPLDAATFELRKMYVQRRGRGRGIGRRLLERAIEEARRRGATTIVLDTLHTMEAAIRLYERYGFVRDDAQIRGARCTRGYRLDLA
ncbi:MAG TPA: GNAT family N-acetyltransferase [Sandaracinaceae bacterium]